MKQKRKRKHLERTSSPQTVKRSKASTNVEEVLQHEQSAVASTSGQTEKDSSSSSECFSTSSQEKLTGAGILKSSKCDPPPGHSLEDNTAVPEAKEILKKQKDTPQPGESTSQEEHSAVVSSDLPCASDNKNTEILKKQKDTPQPGESTSQEEHSAVVSSDLPCASDNKNTEVLNTDEDILLSGPSGLAQGHSQRAEVSDSEYISRISPADKLFDREFWKNQENVPQPESYVVSPGSEIAGEKSSSSEYVCISPSGSHQKTPRCFSSWTI
ncbi:probable GPI-anchored adhesin-like protein PGA55 isoform X2 [Canis lupus familiaris]|uniref:probable GPI-anchored adhesin-like protein PGA55 isoform X2 n=1 Tax=Canis lupus familiaris TaxID=9615 RepID=UPI0018F68E53|nr:probable GPI-anchored adhesin-like protein PGA55 isoform X2 [Canis lupus familiaris]